MLLSCMHFIMYDCCRSNCPPPLYTQIVAPSPLHLRVPGLGIYFNNQRESCRQALFACLIIRIFQLVFSVGTVFFSLTINQPEQCFDLFFREANWAYISSRDAGGLSIKMNGNCRNKPSLISPLHLLWKTKSRRPEMKKNGLSGNRKRVNLSGNMSITIGIYKDKMGIPTHRTKKPNFTYWPNRSGMVTLLTQTILIPKSIRVKTISP